MNRFHTTITEKGDFRTCRRRWYYQNVERLAPKDSVGFPLIFGECIHKALESYYRNNRSLKLALAAFNRAWRKETDVLMRTYGQFYQYVEQEWYEHLVKGKQMLKYYSRFDKQEPFWKNIIAVNIEERAFVDIVDTNGNPIAGRPLLSGRIDLVVERHDGIWIVDHKTAAQKPSDAALDVDDQLTGYAYLYWRLTGDVPRGVIYNVLLKEPPVPPRVLNNGSLSKDKGARTTYDIYLSTIQELGLDIDEYEDHLEYLQQKGWSQFFFRSGMSRNIEQILNFERRLAHEFLDMSRALSEDMLYPNPSQYNCAGCSILPLCKAMEDGSDAEWIKESAYVIQEPRTTIPKDILDPAWEGV